MDTEGRIRELLALDRDINEDESAEVMAALDVITDDNLRQDIADHFPLEWDEWHWREEDAQAALKG